MNNTTSSEAQVALGIENNGAIKHDESLKDNSINKESSLSQSMNQERVNEKVDDRGMNDSSSGVKNNNTNKRKNNFYLNKNNHHKKTEVLVKKKNFKQTAIKKPNKDLDSKQIDLQLLQEEQNTVASQPLSEQEQLKGFIHYMIRQKTGIVSEKINDLLTIYKNKYKDCDLGTDAGTNILGFCLINDNAKAIEYLVALYDSEQLIFPTVLGAQNINVAFTKSAQVNKTIIDFLKCDEKNKEILLEQIMQFAPNNLYRQENVGVYLGWLANNATSDYKEQFMRHCIVAKNKAIISKAIVFQDCRTYLKDNYKQLINDKSFKLWFESQLGLVFDTSASLTQTPVTDSVDNDTDAAANSHLSSKADNQKAFSNIMDKRVVVIERKKRLTLNNK